MKLISNVSILKHKCYLTALYQSIRYNEVDQEKANI